MSNLILNLRVWRIHFQVMRDRPWLRIGFNAYIKRARPFVELLEP